jgi:hypothetical protein
VSRRLINSAAVNSPTSPVIPSGLPVRFRYRLAISFASLITLLKAAMSKVSGIVIPVASTCSRLLKVPMPVFVSVMPEARPAQPAPAGTPGLPWPRVLVAGIDSTEENADNDFRKSDSKCQLRPYPKIGSVSF